jgi:hypothetical protein
MARQKLPLRIVYRDLAHSPNHTFPFHLTGMIEEEKRHVIAGLTEEQARKLYEKLGKALDSDQE